MKMFQRIQAAVRNWRTKVHNGRRRRHFDQLTPAWQSIMKFMGDDPDTLEAKEAESGVA